MWIKTSAQLVLPRTISFCTSATALRTSKTMDDGPQAAEETKVSQRTCLVFIERFRPTSHADTLVLVSRLSDDGWKVRSAKGGRKGMAEVLLRVGVTFHRCFVLCDVDVDIERGLGCLFEELQQVILDPFDAVWHMRTVGSMSSSESCHAKHRTHLPS